MHCKKIDMMTRPNGDVVLELTVDGYYNMRKATQLYNDLKDKEIHATLKEFKSSRSIDQNDMLWAIITQVSDKVNGSHQEQDLMNVYGTILQRANIKREYIRTLVQARDILEQSFRAVLEVPNSRKIENGKETVGFWVYYGSSTFDTREMTQLIEVALDIATEVGIDIDRQVD
jgi:hypothetical protein